MTRRFQSSFALPALVLAFVPACISDPPQRPPALDPSNPRAPESAPMQAGVASAPSTPTPGAPATEHQSSAPGSSARPAATDKPGSQTEYTCSMHPQIRQATPGRCPICGMELVPAAKDQAHDHGAPP